MKFFTGIQLSPKYVHILEAVTSQMSDGIWENTVAMKKYQRNLNYESSPTGELIIIDEDGVCANPVYFFANKIKQIIKEEIEAETTPGLVWNRTCGIIPRYIPKSLETKITVGDCFELYEKLRGKDTSRYHYASYRPYNVKLIYAGTSFDFAVEALSERIAKQKAIKQLTTKLTASINAG